MVGVVLALMNFIVYELVLHRCCWVQRAWHQVPHHQPAGPSAGYHALQTTLCWLAKYERAVLHESLPETG